MGYLPTRPSTAAQPAVPHQATPPPRMVDLAGLRALAGHPIGTSAWHRVTQEQIQGFADATGDHQWIHVDPERAAAGPFGTTIAHGYLTLASAPMLLWEVLEVTGASSVINYGLGRVRFPAPVPVGSRICGSWSVEAVEDVPGGVQVTFGLVVQSDASTKPVCIAEILFRYYA